MPVHCHNNRNAPLKPTAIRSFATGLLLFFADWRTNEMAVVSLTIQQKIELKATHCLLTLGKTFKFEQNANRLSLFIEISRANVRCGTEAIAVSAVSILPIFSAFTKYRSQIWIEWSPFLSRSYIHWSIDSHTHTRRKDISGLHGQTVCKCIKNRGERERAAEKRPLVLFSIFFGILHQMIILFQLLTLEIAAKWRPFIHIQITFFRLPFESNFERFYTYFHRIFTYVMLECFWVWLIVQLKSKTDFSFRCYT